MINRIKEIIDYLGVSMRNFEITIGASNGLIRKAITNNTDIQSKWISSIVENYPQINLNWLITGEGEMIKTEESYPAINYNNQGNPYYNVDFTGSFNLMYNDQTATPEYFINFEPFNVKNGLWCNIAGKSMEPEINNGDKICIKEVKDWQTFMPYGEIYGIVTDEFRTVKRVGKSERDGCVKLIPSNPAYDPQDLPICKIIAVFQVVGAVKMF